MKAEIEADFLESRLESVARNIENLEKQLRIARIERARLRGTICQLRALNKASERGRLAPEYIRQRNQILFSAVKRMRSNGMSWPDVGAVIGKKNPAMVLYKNPNITPADLVRLNPVLRTVTWTPEMQAAEPVQWNYFTAERYQCTATT